MELRENESLFTPHNIHLVKMKNREVFHLEKQANWKQIPFPE